MSLTFQDPVLRADRLQQSIKSYQDSGHDNLFSENLISPFLFFKKINYYILNIANENGEMCQFENDLFNSLELIENYFQELTPDDFNSSVIDFIPLFIDAFININIFNSSDDHLFQYNNAIFSKILNCMYFLVSNDSLIFRNYYSCDFLERLIGILIDDSPERNEEIANLSQLIFAKLFEDEVFKFERCYADWINKINKITNLNEDILFKIYYEFSKNPEKINLDCVHEILYFILKAFPEKENFEDKIELMKMNTKAIINCIEDVSNVEVLTVAQRDIYQFMYKITDLIEFETFNELHFQFQNMQTICFCELMSCFIRKGIISNMELFTDNDNHIISILANIFEFLVSFDKSNPDFFDENRLDKTVGKMLDLFSNFVDLKYEIYRKISIPDCIKFALDNSFKIRKSSAVLVCKIIDRIDAFEDEDLSEEEDESCIRNWKEYFISGDNNLYRLILNLILYGAIEIMEPLLNCVRTLFDYNYCFINFILNPDQFGEFDGLIEILNDMYNDPKITNQNIIDLLEDILKDLKDNSPKPHESIYNSNYGDDNVYDDM